VGLVMLEAVKVMGLVAERRHCWRWTHTVDGKNGGALCRQGRWRGRLSVVQMLGHAVEIGQL
jgi:hypothetical protein